MSKIQLTIFIFLSFIPYILEASSLELSSQERAYLEKKGPIRLCIQPELFPYDGYEDGEHIGVVGDVYHYFAQELNISFRYVVPKTHDELNRVVKENACDMVSVIVKNQRRFPNIIATNAYFSETYFTIITKNDKAYNYTPKSLQDKLLLTRFQSFKAYLLSLYPYLNIEVVSDQNKVIEMLLNDEAYGVIAVNELADFIIQKYGYKQLNINGVLARDHAIQAAIGILESEPVLLGIINKVLHNIDPLLYENIKGKWRISRFIDKTDYTLLAQVVAMALLVIVIVVYWNRKLQKEVKKRVRAEFQLQELNQTLENRVLEGIDEIHNKEKLLLSQSRSAQMGEMISMIAHQWRQPLTAINASIIGIQTKISLEMFDLKTQSGRDAFIIFVNEKFAQISSYVEFLSTTIDDFRYFYKKDKEKTYTALSEPVNSALKLIKASLDANGISVITYFESSDKRMLFHNEVTQVILNLLKNAEDNFLEQKIKNPCIEIKVKKDDTKDIIEICDNGGGIDPKLLPSIFDPYFSTKLEKNGTGLGLYMSKLIIQEHHQGILNVENRLKGVCFQIILNKGLHA